MNIAAPLQARAAKAQALSSSPHAGLLLQWKCACGSPRSSLTAQCGECQEKNLQGSPLAIGAPDDRFEQEADRVADAVVAGKMASLSVSSVPIGNVQRGNARKERTDEPALQRKVAAPVMQSSLFVSPGYKQPKPASCEAQCVKSTSDEDECENCCVTDCCSSYPEDKKEECKVDCIAICNTPRDVTGTVPIPSDSVMPAGLQRKATGTMIESIENDAAPPIVDEVLRSPGQPLNTATRAFMEPRFGYDFSQVRVHFGAAAEQSAREVNADAYTVGSNIVFGAGQFAPRTHEGRRLLAHELTHVVQQGPTNPRRVVLRFPSKYASEDVRNPPTQARDCAEGNTGPSGADLLQTGPACGCSPCPTDPCKSNKVKGPVVKTAFDDAARWLGRAWSDLDLHVTSGTPVPKVTAALKKHFGSSSSGTSQLVATEVDRLTNGAGPFNGNCPETCPVSAKPGIDTFATSPIGWAHTNCYNFCDPFFTKTTPELRARIVLHEMAHSWLACQDHANEGDANYPPGAAINNADSYACLIRDLQ